MRGTESSGRLCITLLANSEYKTIFDIFFSSGGVCMWNGHHEESSLHGARTRMRKRICLPGWLSSFDICSNLYPERHGLYPPVCAEWFGGSRWLVWIRTEVIKKHRPSLRPTSGYMGTTQERRVEKKRCGVVCYNPYRRCYWISF